MLFLTFGCNSQNSGDKRLKLPGVNKYPRRSFNGYKIPIFDSGKQQLAYAQTGFDSKAEQLAALKAVPELFPASRLESGLASLEITYLTLGDDYRLTSTNDCERALTQYLRLVSKYSDIPEIAAKAQWYMGWIISDLLNKPEEGSAHYLQLLQIYPDTRINLRSPPPWISIFDRDDTKVHTPFIPKSTLSWAELALLELIRHSKNPTRCQTYLYALQDRTENHYLLVASLRLFVTNHGLNNSVEKRVREIITLGKVSSRQIDDLESILTDNEA